MSLSTNVTDLAVAIGTEIKATRTLGWGNAADLSALTTAQKTSLLAAINWLHSELQTVAGGAAGINDGAVSTQTTWSSSKTSTEIGAAVSALVDGAPELLDTLNELATALGGQDSAIQAIETALANRVRYDAAQTLDGTQQAQARSNIGAGTSSLVLGTTAGTAKAGDYQPSSANISDATTTGRAVMTAASQAAARTAIGAGTSSLVIGTTASTAKAGNWFPTWTEVSSKPATFAPSAHQHPSTDVSDSTATGRAVLTAADAAAARNAIGAGTGNSNLVLGTTAGTAKAGDYQPTASQISDATAVGRNVLTAVDAATARGVIGAGTSSLVLGTTAGTAKAGDYQPTWTQVTGKPATFAPSSHSHPAAEISDSTAVGRSVLTAASAGAILTSIGAVSTTAVGDTEHDFVADFEAALV